jgi:ABC-2 type transport system permease protein
MTTATTVPARALTRRRSGFGPLLRAEALLFARSAGSVLWTALAPIAALVVIGAFHGVREPNKALHGISYLDAYLPILMIFSLCMSTVNLLPPTLAIYREKGILRRLSTTPVPPARLLAAQATIYLGIALVVSVILLVIAVAAYDVPLPHQLPGFVLSIVLVAGATTGLGLLVAGLSPTGKAANAIAMALFFPLMFLAGLWIPRAQMPSALRTVSDYSPLGAGVRSIQSSIDGHWPPTAGLLVLVAYAVAFGTVAVRTFRWE